MRIFLQGVIGDFKYALKMQQVFSEDACGFFLSFITASPKQVINMLEAKGNFQLSVLSYSFRDRFSNIHSI